MMYAHQVEPHMYTTQDLTPTSDTQKTTMQPRTDLIQWDLELDEPFIALPSFPELRLTPWRRSDADEAVSITFSVRS